MLTNLNSKEVRKMRCREAEKFLQGLGWAEAYVREAF
jgi:hypothetical protein